MTDEELVTQSVAALQELYNQMWNAISAWADDLCKALMPVMEAVREFTLAVYREWKIAYTEAGMPYGDCDKGMYRWLEEVSTIAGLRREADEKEEWLRFLGDWRRKGKTSR